MKKLKNQFKKYWERFDARSKNYSIAFVISLLVYAIFLFGNIGDTVVMFIFFISTYFLVFSPHKKYHKEEEIEEPEPYVEQNVRLNLYSFRFVFIVAFCSLLFYIGAVLFSIKAGIVALVLWIIILASYYKISLESRFKLHDQLLFQYTAQSLRDVTQDKELIQSVVDFYTSNNLHTDPEMIKIIEERFEKSPDILIQEIIDAIIDFETAYAAEYE